MYKCWQVERVNLTIWSGLFSIQSVSNTKWAFQQLLCRISGYSYGSHVTFFSRSETCIFVVFFMVFQNDFSLWSHGIIEKKLNFWAFFQKQSILIGRAGRGAQSQPSDSWFDLSVRRKTPDHASNKPNHTSNKPSHSKNSWYIFFVASFYSPIWSLSNP